ncbi:ATPase-like, ParA/MinD [Methanocaldococcus infernus ME]|uniref:Iron-sulfur cluster carrier protein n=1 Tax=Methanocaldococcus infernus (strain DSM 11812 / JCM 15783 / ME) TaxID=573063 RepID=D5VQD8_METIM|nr:ATPase-like, ParA/MinD [Methanocaldococcus infernus ME]
MECNGKCDSCKIKDQCPDTKKFFIQQENKIKERMSKIKYKIAILSGKGGVGKSTVSTNLAVALAKRGKKVGLLDADIHGPNVPKILGLEGYPEVREGEIIPLEKYGVKVISMANLLPDEKTPIIWRGPKVSGAIRQFLADVNWGELDYLIIDTPPGTGDVQLTIMQSIPLDGAIIVTTPEELSVLDVRKSISMAKMLKVPILGIIENMSGFVCPKCGELTYIFGVGGGEKAAKEFGVDFLGRIPIDIKAREAQDKGVPMVLMDCRAKEEFEKIIDKIIEKL